MKGDSQYTEVSYVELVKWLTVIQIFNKIGSVLRFETIENPVLF